MIESTWAKAWATLEVLYPQAKQVAEGKSEASQLAYWSLLEGYWCHEIENAVGIWIRKSKWFPSVADLIAEMSLHRNSLGGDWETIKRGLLCEEAGVPVDRALGADQTQKMLDQAIPGWRQIGGEVDTDDPQ